MLSYSEGNAGERKRFARSDALVDLGGTRQHILHRTAEYPHRGLNRSVGGDPVERGSGYGDSRSLTG